MISISGLELGVGRRWIPAAAADAADGAADVAVDEAERGGHELAEVRDGEQRQWDAENGVDNRRHLTPGRLRRYVTVSYARHNSMVRNSVSGRRIFPDLRPICG